MYIVIIMIIFEGVLFSRSVRVRAGKTTSDSFVQIVVGMVGWQNSLNIPMLHLWFLRDIKLSCDGGSCELSWGYLCFLWNAWRAKEVRIEFPNYMTICQKQLTEVLYQLLIIRVDLVVLPLRYEAARN